VSRVGEWVEERLELEKFSKRYLKKAFPTHSTFLFGEMAIFSFVMLVLTGIFLGFVYEPSVREVNLFGRLVPAAYASVVKIDLSSFGLLTRRVHHWSAMLMIASVLIHLSRVYFTGCYKNPREINWLIGLALFGVTFFASFTGYLLPYSEFSVTATSVGYYIAKSVPWLGDGLSRLLFGGSFPANETIPRFFFMHVMLLPVTLILLVTLHMVILVKQKHSEPSGNLLRPESRGGKHLIGIPLWPNQVLISLTFFFIMAFVIFFVAVQFPANPVEKYGPPGPGTPVMRPDWYFLAIYGLLKLIPGTLHLEILGAKITSETVGGVFFPGIVGFIFLSLPFFDRKSTPQHYMENPLDHPFRTSIGIMGLFLAIMLTIAGYIDVLGVSPMKMSIYVVIVTVTGFIAPYLILGGKSK
jgi:cytochrome b-561